MININEQSELLIQKFTIISKFVFPKNDIVSIYRFQNITANVNLGTASFVIRGIND